MFAGHSLVGTLLLHDTGPLSHPGNTGYSHSAVSMLFLATSRITLYSVKWDIIIIYPYQFSPNGDEFAGSWSFNLCF